VLSGRGLCDELITCPEESYRLWCIVVCDLENLKNEEVMTRVGSQHHSKKKSLIKSSNSLFILILHVPSLSFVRPKILRNTFLSNTINLCTKHAAL
jgi:hypothetical protein